MPEYYSVRKTCEDNEQYRINITVDKQSFFRRSKRERNFPPFFLLHKRAKAYTPPFKDFVFIKPLVLPSPSTHLFAHTSHTAHLSTRTSLTAYHPPISPPTLKTKAEGFIELRSSIYKTLVL